MRGNESFAFILPITSVNGEPLSAVQREQAAPAIFSASLPDHDFSAARVSHLNVLNSQCSRARTPTGPLLISLS